ncbi:FAD-dependent oxidoreductase [soil metagenome]
MAYVITQNCCKDASCVPVCPVDCIRPTGAASEFTGTEMLYIDPESCIDCGACMDECPVDAIHYDEDLPAELERFKDINAAYFERHPLEPDTSAPQKSRGPVPAGALRVAIVGAGPAACYAAAELIEIDGVEVDMFERLPTPFGLIRAGVAPDHQHTKSVVNVFNHVFASKRFGCHLNVEVGRDLTHADLMAHHHAVIYAVGASRSRDLGIPGERLPGNHAAADFVGWYNGHPDHAGHQFDLSTRRAVIIGNGNVALDVARVLLMDRDQLSQTDIAQHALDALADSAIDEVIVLGRRGPRDGAFSVGEFLALGHLPGVDVVIDGGDLDDDPADDIETVHKLAVAREYAQRTPTPGNKRIVFRFLTSPTEVVGADRVEGLQVNRAGETELIETVLILRSIGYYGSAIDGLPYDSVRGVIPNGRGRVADDDGTVAGVYVTGWIKRGPRGVIGTNRTCAHETVAELWQDYTDGTLTRDVSDRDAVRAILARRGAEAVDWTGWRAIDAAERKSGSDASRPRVKFVAVDEMVAAART